MSYYNDHENGNGHDNNNISSNNIDNDEHDHNPTNATVMEDVDDDELLRQLGEFPDTTQEEVDRQWNLLGSAGAPDDEEEGEREEGNEEEEEEEGSGEEQEEESDEEEEEAPQPEEAASQEPMFMTQQHQQHQTQTQMQVSPTQSAPPPSAFSQMTSPNYAMPELTRTDGIRQWGSWTRVFVKPRDACLDLLDNSLDAALYLKNITEEVDENFYGKVEMSRLAPNGIAIINNSAKRIRKLADILVVYGSTKGVGDNAKQDAIGENGIGLKHGCATLSQTNLVLTRNHNVFSLGIIAKALQTEHGICLPSFEFTVPEPEEKTPGEIEQELKHHIQLILQQNPKIAQCIAQDFGRDTLEETGTIQRGIQRLVERYQMLWGDKWGDDDHVFMLLITDLIHTHAAGGDSGVEANSSRAHNSMHPATVFLQEIKHMLPKHYINIPPTGFEFKIEQANRQLEPVQFSYWQQRLVELSKFTVYVHNEQSAEDLHDVDWDKHGYPLSIYCGFDPIRLTDEDEGHNLSLLIYSRKSGRLIENHHDGRGLLKLSNQGSDYGQGLTVIVDDIHGKLPLMPTKQGIAWSEEKYGELHKSNFLAWVSAVSATYYDYHLSRLWGRKTNLTHVVKEWADPVRKYIADQAERPFADVKRLEVSELNTYSPEWKKSKFKKRFKIMAANKNALGQHPYFQKGRDTRFEFTKDQIVEHMPEYSPMPTPAAPSRKRARLSSGGVGGGLEEPHVMSGAFGGGAAAAAASHGGQQPPNNVNSNNVIVLDDDDDDNDPPAWNNGQQQTTGSRALSRKSTGGPAPGRAAGPVHTVSKRTSNNAALEKEIQSLRHQLDASQKASLHFQGRVKQAAEALTFRQRQNEQMARQLQRERERHRTQITTLQGENEKLRRQLQEKDRLITKLKSERAAPAVAAVNRGGGTTSSNSTAAVSEQDNAEQEMGLGAPGFLDFLRQQNATNEAGTFTI